MLTASAAQFHLRCLNVKSVIQVFTLIKLEKTGAIPMRRTVLLSLISSLLCLLLQAQYSQMLQQLHMRLRKFVPNVLMAIHSVPLHLQTKTSPATNAQSTSLDAPSANPLLNATFAMTASTSPMTEKNVLNPSISASPLPSTTPTTAPISTASSASRASSSTLRLWNAKNATKLATPAQTLTYVLPAMRTLRLSTLMEDATYPFKDVSKIQLHTESLKESSFATSVTFSNFSTLLTVFVLSAVMFFQTVMPVQT
mgnify:FL=1